MKYRTIILSSIVSVFVVSILLAYNQQAFTKSGPITSLDEFSKMEKKYDRIKALENETPANRSVLWREHLDYSARKLELKGEQLDFVNQLSGMLDENIFIAIDSKPSEVKFFDTPKGKPIGEFVKQVPVLFTREQAKQLFMTVGDVSTIKDFGCGPKSLNASTSGANAPCGCVASFCWHCPSGYKCLMTFPQPGGNCTPTSTGCGCFGWDGCNAACTPSSGDS